MQQNLGLCYQKVATMEQYSNLERLVQSGQHTSELAKILKDQTLNCISFFEQEIYSLSNEIQSQNPIIRLHKHPPSSDPTQLIIDVQTYSHYREIAQPHLEKQNALQGIINNFLTLHSSLGLLINQYSNQQTLKQEQRFPVKQDPFQDLKDLESIQQELPREELITQPQESSQPPPSNNMQPHQFDNPASDFQNQKKQITQKRTNGFRKNINHRSKKIMKQSKKKSPKQKVIRNRISFGQLKQFEYQETLYSAVKDENNRSCYMCHRPANKNLGKLVALPYNQELLACHDSCALWSSELYLKPRENTYHQNKLENLLRNIKAKECSICHKMNASLKCNEEFCTNIYHFPCFMENEEAGGVIDKFQVICSNHYNKYYLQQIEEYSNKLNHNAERDSSKPKEHIARYSSACELYPENHNDQEKLLNTSIIVQSIDKSNPLSLLVQEIGNSQFQNKPVNLEGSNNKIVQPLFPEEQQITANQSSLGQTGDYYPIQILNNPIAQISEKKYEVAPQHRLESTNILGEDHKALQRMLKNKFKINHLDKNIKLEDS